jgi:hypothetical protein
MTGLLFNGIKYIRLCNDNALKKKSLYDNIYFTLRDIFVNAESCDDVMAANQYNRQLTGGIYFEERTEHFEYVQMLKQKNFTESLYKWLHNINNSNYFDFTEPENNYLNVDENEYIKFDDWLIQFEELKILLNDEISKNTHI